MEDNKLIGQATPEQIEQWKQKHASVFALEVGGHVCYLRKPNRRELSAATALGQKDPLQFNEVILENCWLGGSDAIKKDDELFLAASGQLGQLIEVKQAELKKI